MKLPKDFAGLTQLEWLETNALGGYAMGTVAGVGTRGYHGLLAAAVVPPAVRTMVVTGMDEWLNLKSPVYLSTHQYPGVVSPEGYKHIAEFDAAPTPTWVFEAQGVRLERRVFMVHGENTTVVRYRLLEGKPVTLSVRPFFVWRDHHARRHASGEWWVAASRAGEAIHCAPSDGGIPVSVYARPIAGYRDEPLWYRNFEYLRERQRGLEFQEDAFAPFVAELPLAKGKDASLIFTTDLLSPPPVDLLEREELERRAGLAERAGKDPVVQRLAVAADHFLVMRGAGQRSVIAGYPWFTDWGRDTMIALPGLTFETGALEEASLILATFADNLADGLLPNRFPDQQGSAEYNTVDASLWFAVAVHRFKAAGGDAVVVRDVLLPTLQQIVQAFEKGTHFGIHEDKDGLVFAGVEGLALTWMDARVGGKVITPRVGKPVEISALWYNARMVLADLLDAHGDSDDAKRAREKAELTRQSFRRGFQDPKTGGLFDLLGLEDVPDPSVRPNQLFAAALPYPLIEREHAVRMLDLVKKQLLTPRGLRTLAPTDPRYVATYGGPQEQRDAAYHQGTVWPWLLGPYVDALLYGKGDSAETRAEAKEALAPMIEHLDQRCIGQVAEIFDGKPPHAAHGCVAQAWSVAELLRAWRRVTTQVARAPARSSGKAAKPKRTSKPAKKPAAKGKKRG